jgi:hypothetical protein
MSDPVIHCRLAQLAAEYYARGWTLGHDGGQFTASKPGHDPLTAATMPLMRTQLHGAFWESLTGGCSHLREQS